MTLHYLKIVFTKSSFGRDSPIVLRPIKKGLPSLHPLKEIGRQDSHSRFYQCAELPICFRSNHPKKGDYPLC